MIVRLILFSFHLALTSSFSVSVNYSLFFPLYLCLWFLTSFFCVLLQSWGIAWSRREGKVVGLRTVPTWVNNRWWDTKARVVLSQQLILSRWHEIKMGYTLYTGAQKARNWRQPIKYIKTHVIFPRRQRYSWHSFCSFKKRNCFIHMLVEWTIMLEEKIS